MTFTLLTLTACASPHHAHDADHAHHADHAHDTGPGHHHRFDDAERWAAVFDRPERDAWQKPDEVVAASGIAVGHTVADLGAGTGYFLPYLSRAVGPNGKVFALDVEANLVAHMKQRITDEGLDNIETKQIPFDDPGLDASSVDRILIVDTWHHIDDRIAYGKKLRAALKPGGAVVVVDFRLDSPEGPPKEHRLLPEKVAEELRAAGLEATIAETTLPRQYIVVARL